MTPPTSPSRDRLCDRSRVIGLPTAAVLAQAGKTVIGVDVKQANVDAINAGTVPFVEEGLETVVAGVVAQGKFCAQLETPEADAYIVSVPHTVQGRPRR